ncbi:AMIN domain-containing protein [Spirulina sp. CS-785/01]|uniref:AMIN domain-containing protein n=1 Tax=Spirulina sp. CS-785/01 TaxID=3021716 RepID=UPI00232E86E4|nr:AMIN domain-containing protein [Spirulina sp. CS-785/01]MDB9313270.1 AMIN domain-containing protein [Spirulina sp. CS-785/01]
MRAYSKPIGIFTGMAAVLLMAHPAQAANVQVTGVQLQQGEQGFRLFLQIGDSSATPQVFTVTDGNRLVAEVLNSQLNLPSGGSFVQNNPMAGIATVEVKQINAQTVRVVVTGETEAPIGQVVQRESNQIVFGFAPGTQAQLPRLTVERDVNPSDVPDSQAAQPSTDLPPASDFELPDLPTEPAPSNNPENQPPPSPQGQTPPPTPEFDAELFNQLAQRSEVLVPDPEITVEGDPAPAAQPAQPVVPAPPLLPRAVPPPVGDIAVSNVDSAPEVIDLGTSVRVPRIVLQDAPVREVLGILSRSANLNLVYTNGGEGEGGGGGGPLISLDLEDVAVQDVFNAVIQTTGLEVARRGRTIFVGTNLPQDARNIVTRTFRLNQVEAETAATFLASIGAETQLLVQVTEDITNPQTGEVIGRRETPPQLTTVTASRGEGDTAGNYILNGLTVATDDRLNTLTMIGEPRKVSMATTFLTQLDARRRQVAVNVKIIDVNLNNVGRFGTSFSFGLNDTGIINQNGIGIINFGTDDSNLLNEPFIFDPDAAPEDIDGNPVPPSGEAAPSRTGITFDSVGDGVATNPLLGNFSMINVFLAQLQASVQNNDAKVLTDPTLIIQEGQTASVNLTEDVVTGVEVTTSSSGGTVVTETDVEVSEGQDGVGLVLAINVERIDDNGFVTMQINPSVSSIGQVQNIGDNEISLLNRRDLTTGTIRIRDGQTLILSGIIQDQDIVNVQKIPILGDLPLIGSLFRRTTRENQRNEVIVIVTPNVMDDSQQTNSGYTRPVQNPQQMPPNQQFQQFQQ